MNKYNRLNVEYKQYNIIEIKDSTQPKLVNEININKNKNITDIISLLECIQWNSQENKNLKSVKVFRRRGNNISVDSREKSELKRHNWRDIQST